MPTLDDIALSLGVTKGTVSKALNGASDINETTRKIIIERAVELGYSKVSHLNKGKICIFIENMLWKKPEDFGFELIGGFRKMAEPAGYKIDIVELTNEVQKSMTYDMYMLLHGYSGGFLVGLSYSDPWLQEVHTSHTPLAVYDYSIKGNPHATSVGVDNEEAFELAVSHLKSLGHRKLGYLSAALGSYVFQRRYLAFFHALKQNNLPDDHSQAKHDYYIVEKLDTELPELMKAGCSAIICSHDSIAQAAITCCRKLNIAVPEKLSIMGFDDIPSSQCTNPPLTTIRQNRTELGKSAFYALSCQIQEISISSVQLHAELVIRKTTGLPAIF